MPVGCKDGGKRVMPPMQLPLLRGRSHSQPGLVIETSVPSLSNGVRNQLLPQDSAVHEWYRFVLSFPPHLVRQYLDRFSIGARDLVLDPFCGTGTTLVECKKLGVESIGIEAHPMAHLASSAKTDWSANPDLLWKGAQSIAENALNELRGAGIEDNPIFDVDQHVKGQLRDLPPGVAKLLIKDSVSPLPLHKTLVLREHIEHSGSEQHKQYYHLALAKALVNGIGNLRFGPEVGVGKIKKDTPVIEPWLQELKAIANDLREVPGPHPAHCTVHLADSRDMHSMDLNSMGVNAVFTSPPYPNEKDYTRTTRLESVILGFVSSRKDLRQLKEGLIRSNTRNVYRGDQDEKFIRGFPEIIELADRIESRRKELGKTSGFERNYANVTQQYFGGMYRHFASMRSVLASGAYLAYVVGDQASYLRVMIRTGQLLSQIAKSLGYVVESIDLFRTRLATATKRQLREEVVVLRWPG